MSFQDPGRTSGGMPMNPWRARLRRASYRGVPFFTEVDGKAGGRRNAVHEYPKRDVPYTEDMGRKARRHFIVGYVIANAQNGFNHLPQAAALIDACEQEGPGTLVHPLIGSERVNLDTYTVTNDEKRGGMAMFEFSFIEAGQAAGTAVTDNSSAQSSSNAANAADGPIGNELNNNVPVAGGASLGQGGIGHA